MQVVASLSLWGFPKSLSANKNTSHAATELESKRCLPGAPWTLKSQQRSYACSPTDYHGRPRNKGAGGPRP